MMRTYLLLYLLLTGLFSCNKDVSTPENLDIIEFQTIYAGDTAEIQIDDLFYTEDYSDFNIKSTNLIQMDFDSFKNTLYITADPEEKTLRTLPFTFNGFEYQLPLRILKKKSVEFIYHPQDSINSISIFGSFNSWNREQYPMEMNDAGTYSFSLPFDAGRYEYRFHIDGKDILDPLNSEKVPNGLGDFNSLLTVKKDFEGETPFISFLDIENQNNGRIDYLFIILNRDYDKSILKSDIIALWDNSLISEKQYIIQADNTIRLALSKQNFNMEGIHHLRLAISNAHFSSNILDVILEDGKALNLANQQKTWNDAVIYSLMIDRFVNGDDNNDKKVLNSRVYDRANFNGGDLQGILDKLEIGYFTRLGINTLWLSPWLQNTENAYQETPKPHRWFTGYHGYWPIEPRKVSSHFGDNDVLKKLIDEAHSSNIKILMDFVSNHVHEDHPYYQRHPEWFGQLELEDGRKNLRLWDEQRLTTWFDPYLPSFDYVAAPEAADSMIADAIWWINEYNIDGFRHDAVKHVPNSFWKNFTKTLRKTYPEKKYYQIGETFGDYNLVKSYVNNGQLDAQFNFNLYWPARYAFVTDSMDFTELSNEIEKSLDVYGQLNVMGNVYDSHDQPRFPAYIEKDLSWSENTSEAGWNRHIRVNRKSTYDKIRLYMTYLISIPGIPIIYYGDEIGMTGAGDPDNRRMMRWGKDINDKEKALRSSVSQLINIRNNHSALRYGDFLPVHADKTTLAYIRSDFNERILVVIYRNDKGNSLEIELPEAFKIRNIEALLNSVEFEFKENILTLNAEKNSAYLFTLN